MSLLGLDLGTKTLGLALSDKTNTIASPYKTLTFKKIEDVLPELTTLIESKKIEKLILGYPKNMNNSLGLAIERTNQFKELLEKNFKLPIILIDERLSTIEAEKILIATDMSREKRKKVIDAYAASIILDTYLKESRD
ncbi:MAG: Holliday junction resolvase RuvX [Bacilli bacterium]|nr:Holliday junction resolvase RuvX [Bacilli bacterium]